jgi:hypothetical protein
VFIGYSLVDVVDLGELMEHELLHVPQLGGEVNVVVVGIFKALDLVPQPVHLTCAVGANLFNVGQVVDTLTVLENGSQQGHGFIVGEGLTLPCGFGIKQLQRLSKVRLFVKGADIVRHGLAGGFVKQTVDLLEVGNGHLGRVLADLDLGDNMSLGVLNGDKLVNAGGRVLGVSAIGDSLTEAIDLAYEKCKKISFANAYYRSDIGARAKKALRGDK